MKAIFALTRPFKTPSKALQVITLLFISLLLISNQSASAPSSDHHELIRLATTTSTQNSGLLDYLLPVFEKDSGYKVHTIAVGTGKALRMGRDGDVDVLLVHALKAEKKFIDEGHGEKRFYVMHNDFVIVGPKEDPAKLSTTNQAGNALEKIATHKSRFISRGDNSGTHKKELGLWKLSGIKPSILSNRWYLEAGQGMGKVLQMAGELDAYTLTDRGTWLTYQAKSPLKITFEGDSTLFNPYGIIAVNPKKYADLNNTGANALIAWMTSKKGQTMISRFKVNDQLLFTPSFSSSTPSLASTSMLSQSKPEFKKLGMK